MAETSADFLHPSLLEAYQAFASADDQLHGHRLKCALAAIIGYRPSNSELVKHFGKLSATREEFFLFGGRFLQRVDGLSQLRRLFKALDRQGKGFLELTDLLDVVSEERLNVPEADLCDAFTQADTLGSGKVTLAQFESFLRGASSLLV